MNTTALVTLYYPDDSVRKNVVQLSMLVDKVVLLDNTPDCDNSGLFADMHNVEYVAFKKNCGLSEAFNHCLKTLKENCYIVFFDQDSWCPENLMAQLKADYEICREMLGEQGIIGPVYFEKNAGKIMLPKRKKVIADGLYAVSSIITSGMFTELEVMKRIGFWNEEIFLDMADWDICWRTQKAGMFCCLSENVVLIHSLGKGEKKIGFMRIKTGAACRVYYQIRDCLRLMKKLYVPFKFKVRFFFMLTIRPIVHFIFLGDKKERLRYFVKGIRDYKDNRYGALITGGRRI